MGYRKCPRCELNYIRDGEKLCGVCKNAVLTSCEPDEDDDLVSVKWRSWRYRLTTAYRKANSLRLTASSARPRMRSCKV